MKSTAVKLFGGSLCVVWSVCGVAAWGSAQVSQYSKEGFYVGLSMPYVSMGHDFDGETVFVGASDVVLVPEVDSNFGLGVAVGMRAANASFELNYIKSSHDATFAGFTGDVEYQQFGFDVRMLHGRKEGQPYLLFGLFFPQLVLKDGSATAGGSIGDASYRGMGGNLGAGFLYHLHPRFALDFGVLYRLAFFGSAKGAAGSRETLDEDLLGGGPGITVGGTFTF
jgi:hypothetical protein